MTIVPQKLIYDFILDVDADNHANQENPSKC